MRLPKDDYKDDAKKTLKTTNKTLTLNKTKMKTEFTKAEMKLKQGCYRDEKGKLESLSFMKTEKDVTLESILDSEISLKDKGWFIRNSCELTLDEKKEFAIGCALCVLPIYETKYPNNLAPRKAIEAAQAYLKNQIGINELRRSRNAAYATAATADAAYATAATADAAYATAATADAAYAAADAAAYAAADAAAAAAYAADAAAATAAATAADVNYQDLLLIFFKEFTSKTKNI